jgi:hypothetical protein
VLRVTPNVSIRRAYFERLDAEHWLANVSVQHHDGPTENLLFALEPGYCPIEDGGFAASAEIIDYLKEIA